jgi:ATP-binding cassette subfamily B multidrug efflux pump
MVSRRPRDMLAGMSAVTQPSGPEEAKGRAVPRPGTLSRLFRGYAWPHRWSFAAGTVALLVTNYLTVSIPGQLGAGIDALTVDGDLVPFALTIAWMGAGLIVVRTASRVLFFNPGRDIEYRIRQDLFSHLMELQPDFYAHSRSGDIVSRASNDITWARAMVGFGLLQLVNVVLAVSMTGWKMLTISPWLTFMALVPVVIGLGLVQIFIRNLFGMQKQAQEEMGAISDHVLDSFQGVATIQGFGAEPAFVDLLTTKNQAWLHTIMRVSMIRSMAFPILSVCGGIAVFVLLWVGAPMAVSGEITVGDVAAYAALIAALVPPLRSMGWMLSVIQRGRASLERIFELLDAPVACPEGADGIDEPGGSGPGIEVSGLSFAYPDQPDELVLKDISLSIPAGAVVGIFGRTGCGKTTLLRVLSRLYNPPEGTISVDGQDITRWQLKSWRRRVAVAPQRPFLFSESIADNVGLGGSITAERVEAAVQLAALGSDLEVLPQGIDTVVGQRGIMLSGGQRQRVALARALARGSDLVLLDDVLSAVDHSTEQRLVQAIRAQGRGRAGAPTVLIVSQRLSAIRHADCIFVLEDGRLTEQGTHKELVTRPGVYRDSWRVQAEEA